MRIVAGQGTLWTHVRITVDGNPVPFVKFVDTDLGIAECAMYFETAAGNKHLLVSYEDIVDDDNVGEFGVINLVEHSYTLHNFEVWDTLTNELIAKV